MADGAARNTKLMELFGRTAGPALLQSGAIDNLKEMVEATRTLGVDTTPQAIASAAEFQRQMADLGMVSSGVLQDLLNAMSGGPSGVGGMLDAITRGMIIFGETAKSVLTFVSTSFQTTGLLIMAAGNALTGNFKRAMSLVEEAERTAAIWTDMESLGDRIEKKINALNVLQQKRSEAGKKEGKEEVIDRDWETHLRH